MAPSFTVNNTITLLLHAAASSSDDILPVETHGRYRSLLTRAFQSVGLQDARARHRTSFRTLGKRRGLARVRARSPTLPSQSAAEVACAALQVPDQLLNCRHKHKFWANKVLAVQKQLASKGRCPLPQEATDQSERSTAVLCSRALLPITQSSIWTCCIFFANV